MAATVQNHRNRISEAAIFARVWDEGEYPLTPPVARHVLKLRFSATDKARMHELAAKNQRGKLSGEEREELDNFIRVGDLLAILQSKARKRLKQTPRESMRHG